MVVEGCVVSDNVGSGVVRDRLDACAVRLEKSGLRARQFKREVWC